MPESSYPRISYLMKQCMLQQETAEERLELDRYCDSPLYASYVQQALLEAYNLDKPLTDLSEVQQEQVWGAIKSLDVVHKEKKTVRLSRLYRWSAIAATILLIGGWLFYNKREGIDQHLPPKADIADVDWSSNSPSTASKTGFVDLKPAQEQALMTLSDGSNIDVGELKTGDVIVRVGLKIEKLDQGNLSIQFENNNGRNHAGRMNSITTPRGAFYNIKLGDGTKVQLNASSTLRFPSRFSVDQRDVYLAGEGYFEVTKDKLRKFVVHSEEGQQQQQVVVYGTVFNVMAYPENKQIVTTLLEGSVKVVDPRSQREVFLKPQQQTVLQAGQLELRPADMNACLAWKNNLFYFADERLENVMIEISRWYDVNINFEGLLLDYKVWAQISRTKPLSEVLDLLAKTNNIQFDIKGKEVFIRMK